MTERFCPACGEPSPAERRTCWLCGESLEGVESSELRGATARRAARRRASDIAILMTTIAVVAVGVSVFHPGIGIAGAILVAIPALRTVVVTRARAERGRPVSLPVSIALFATSLVVTWVIVTVVGVAAVGTFCFTCVGAHSGGLPEGLQIAIAGGATLIVVGGLSALFFKWIVSRYRRDTLGK